MALSEALACKCSLSLLLFPRAAVCEFFSNIRSFLYINGKADSDVGVWYVPAGSRGSQTVQITFFKKCLKSYFVHDIRCKNTST